MFWFVNPAQHELRSIQTRAQNDSLHQPQPSLIWHEAAAGRPSGEIQENGNG